MKSKSKFTPKSNLTNEGNSNLELVMNANCRLQVPIPTSRLPLVGAQMSRYAGKATSLLLRSLDLWLRFVWKLLSSDYFEVVPLPPKFLHYEIFSMFFFLERQILPCFSATYQRRKRGAFECRFRDQCRRIVFFVLRLVFL